MRGRKRFREGGHGGISRATLKSDPELDEAGLSAGFSCGGGSFTKDLLPEHFMTRFLLVGVYLESFQTIKG